MKVAVVIDTWFPAVGGGQINAWEISKRLARKRVFVDIITRNNGNDSLPKVRNLQIYKLGSKSDSYNSLSKIIFVMRALFFIMIRDYDLVHIQPFLPGLLAPAIRFFKRIPVVFTVHGTRLFEQKLKNSFGFLLEKIILTKIKYDFIISVTEAFKKIKNINRNIQVIPNGIDFKKFENIKVKKTTYPKILWVGRFDKVKRVDDLIMAMKDVIREAPQAKLTLVGYGDEENNLKKLTRKLHLLKYVRFVGKKIGADLIREYKSSHLFVLPSSSEGYPLAILEAQAASLPVVATRVGGIPEIVVDKKTGILVPPQKPNKLAQAILRVLNGKNSFRKNGFENVKKFYSWDSVAKCTLGVYQKAIHE